MSKAAWTTIGAGVALLVILIIASSLPMPFGGGPGYGWGMMGPWMMGWFGFPFIGGIVMLLSLVLIIGGVVWLVQSLARGSGQPWIGTPAGESPLDILRRRYAKGEITGEQFEQMRRDLGS
jgi:putative membrane protein